MMNFDATSKIGKEAIDDLLTSFSSVSRGFQQIASEAAEYSKNSYEEGAAAVEKLVGAKSVDKAFEIQSDYVRSSYESFFTQAGKVGELYADLAREACKPFEAAVSGTKS